MFVFGSRGVDFSKSFPEIESLVIFDGLGEEVGPVVFGLGLTVHGDHDPAEDFVGFRLAVFDLEFGEFVHVDFGGGLDSFFADLDIFFF